MRDDLHRKTDRQPASLIWHIKTKKSKNVLNGTKEVNKKKQKNKETNGYGRGERLVIEKI